MVNYQRVKTHILSTQRKTRTLQALHADAKVIHAISLWPDDASSLEVKAANCVKSMLRLVFSSMWIFVWIFADVKNNSIMRTAWKLVCNHLVWILDRITLANPLLAVTFKTFIERHRSSKPLSKRDMPLAWLRTESLLVFLGTDGILWWWNGRDSQA